jgi:flagellar biosynthesis/type III secretory pathway M-ring protein FliF/YscJ
MRIDLPTIVIVLLAACALIAFVVIRNRKDRKELEHKLNDDYKKPPEHETDKGEVD